MLETPNKLAVAHKKPYSKYLGKDGTAELRCTWVPWMRKTAFEKKWNPNGLTVKQYEILKAEYCARFAIHAQAYDTE